MCILYYFKLVNYKIQINDNKNTSSKFEKLTNIFIIKSISLNQMSTNRFKEEDEFTLPTQLSKSKLSLKAEKIIKKQNLRSKANLPKMIVDSENQDVQQKQQFIAKKKAKKWWRKYDKKYFAIFQNLEQAENIINKVQQLPINFEKLGTFLQEEYQFSTNNQNTESLLSADSLRVLFRREILLNDQEDNALVIFQLQNLVNMIQKPQVESSQEINSHLMNQQSEQIDKINIYGQTIELSTHQEETIPSNLHIWNFKNLIKDPRNYNDHKMSQSNSKSLYPLHHKQQLTPFMVENSSKAIQKLLRHQKQGQHQNSLDHQIRLWTFKYNQIFQQNQQFLQILAARIQQNIDKRKLQEELKQQQQLIVQITQEELLWSQILLLFKKGHSDKTDQLLSDALQIITIKQMSMKESLRKKKGTSVEKLKSLFQTDCKICFSTENDQKINKVFYCDGCNTSFHQICYGISKEEAEQTIKLQKF